MGQVHLSRLALGDLDDIWLHIAKDNLTAADDTIDRVSEMCGKIARSPQMGRERPELAPHLRSIPVGNLVIFYRASEGGVEVARILSGYRDIDAVFQE